MDTIGIIAEYNPFHNGHLHHINEVKKMYPDSIIILILNGYFLQRGEISILTKEDKTKLALEYGVNLVVELPFVFGTQSADIFAYYSVYLLNELKVNKIIFGSESNDVKQFYEIAKTQSSKKYNKDVKKLLKEGVNYPTAMSKALKEKKRITSPNDLLGISYVKAILEINPDIKAETIQRTNNYHGKNNTGNIVSATYIRNKIKNGNDVEEYMPSKTYKMLRPININYFHYLKFLIYTKKDDLKRYLTVDEGIENKLIEVIMECHNLEELIKAIKTKRYTYNKINRMFIHILIGYTKEINKEIELDYIKILGFDKKGQKHLNKVKKKIELPLYNNKMYSKVKDYELVSSKIYDLITGLNTYEFEIKNKPVKK